MIAGRKVLIVEDEVNALNAMEEYLQRNGLEVTSCIDGEHALAQHSPCDVLVTDWHLGMGATGAEVARELKSRWPQIKIILISAYPEEPIRRQVEDVEITALLHKPLSLPSLLDSIAQAVANDPCIDPNGHSA